MKERTAIIFELHAKERVTAVDFIVGDAIVTELFNMLRELQIVPLNGDYYMDVNILLSEENLSKELRTRLLRYQNSTIGIHEVL